MIQLLYKIHDDPNCELLLNIVRYLHATCNIDLRAKTVIEKNFPEYITCLPTIILYNDQTIVGIDNIITYIESITNQQNLKNKAIIFANNNPNYRMTDKSTHKKLKL
jgi:hypothetical protein